MQPLKARIQNGRILLDEPTDLPDGDVYLVPVDDLTDDERAELEAALEEGLADAQAGRHEDASAVMARLGGPVHQAG